MNKNEHAPSHLEMHEVQTIKNVLFKLNAQNSVAIQVPMEKADMYESTIAFFLGEMGISGYEISKLESDSGIQFIIGKKINPEVPAPPDKAILSIQREAQAGVHYSKKDLNLLLAKINSDLIKNTVAEMIGKFSNEDASETTLIINKDEITNWESPRECSFAYGRAIGNALKEELYDGFSFNTKVVHVTQNEIKIEFRLNSKGDVIG
jgi:hypothetical protein